jgi:hypothetical protein
MEKLEKVVAFLPAFTALALVAAVFYNFGYIYPFGTEWIAVLTAKDLLALTWSSFPMVAVGAVFSATISSTAHSPSQVIANVSNKILATNTWYSLVFAILRTVYVVGAVSLPGWVTIFYVEHPLSLVDTMRVLVLIAFVHLSGVAILFRTSNAADQDRTRVPSLIYNYMVLIVLAGALNGYSRASAEPRYQVTDTTDRKWCATLVHTTDRGPLLFDPVTNEVSLLRWDTIRSISKLKKCVVKPVATPSAPAPNTAAQNPPVPKAP